MRKMLKFSLSIVLVMATACVPVTGLAPTVTTPAVSSSTSQTVTIQPVTVPSQTASVTPLTTMPAMDGTILAGSDGSFVYIRSGPGMSYDRIGTLAGGQPVQITGRSPHNDWWRVMANDVEGWIFASFVRVEGNIQAIPCISNSQSECKVIAIPVGNDPSMAMIRALKGDMDLEVTFLQEETNPNADMRKAFIYTDEGGDEYWIDAQTLVLVQWTPSQSVPVGKTLPVEGLKIAASAFAGRISPIFQEHATALTFTESTKDGTTYAFRWEGRWEVGHMMPPFLQIVMRTDGAILGYINTLDALDPP